MKKLLFLIASVILISYSCNNKPATDAAVTTDTVAVVNTAPVDSDTTTVGAPTVVAQVFEDANGIGVAGATIVVKESKAIETLTSDEKGNYKSGKCVEGHSYTFTCSKLGYTTITSPVVVYKDSTSLPGFAMVKK